MRGSAAQVGRESRNGLPYRVGGIIEKESSLLIADANTFRSQFAVDARTGCEALRISPEKKTVDLRKVATGEVTTESYDKLVLSPGAPSHVVASNTSAPQPICCNEAKLPRSKLPLRIILQIGGVRGQRGPFPALKTFGTAA
jgi:NADPH-dependent 2,4-dienoyl-CoA reductase/sulfur reductase-like enzyme